MAWALLCPCFFLPSLLQGEVLAAVSPFATPELFSRPWQQRLHVEGGKDGSDPCMGLLPISAQAVQFSGHVRLAAPFPRDCVKQGWAVGTAAFSKQAWKNVCATPAPQAESQSSYCIAGAQGAGLGAQSLHLQLIYHSGHALPSSGSAALREATGSWAECPPRSDF